MKIFFVGNFNGDAGPAIVNKLLIKGLSGEEIIYSNSKGKIFRTIELIYKILIADCVCFCSYSKINFIGLRIANMLNKKTFYLMHGYKTYEDKVNKLRLSLNEIKKINYEEKKLIKSVDRVYCVSKKFMQFMKIAEPKFKDKFHFNYNPIDFKEIELKAKNIDKRKIRNQIVSIGGGMKQKNNLSVCKAIDKLNNEKGLNLEFVVIGLPYTDKAEICSYDFVKYYDKLPHQEVLEILAESYLYIQNSIFDTFGLAVIEALVCGCNLLISENVGSIDVINSIESKDIIYDVENINELSEKIGNILLEGNNSRLQEGLNRRVLDYKASSRSLVYKILKYEKEVSK